MNLHKHELYLLEELCDSFKIWLAFIRTNTEGKKSMVIKSSPGIVEIFKKISYKKKKY